MTDRNWTHWFWGRGLRGLRARWQTQGKRYQWTPVRVRLKERARHPRLKWWRWALLDWHGIEEGVESFPRPVVRGAKSVEPNPYWDGHHVTRWKRTIFSQVFHVGPFIIICGEHATERPDSLTDDEVRAIERLGRTAA
jgi:hypothetical protein